MFTTPRHGIDMDQVRGYALCVAGVQVMGGIHGEKGGDKVMDGGQGGKARKEWGRSWTDAFEPVAGQKYLCSS